MPLDADARRYADNLFAERREQIEAESKNKVLAIHQGFRSKNETDSPMYVKAMADERSELLKALCEAKAETLLTAYEKAGMHFDNAAYQEISDELSQFRSQTEIPFAQRIRGMASSTRHSAPGYVDAVLGDFTKSSNSVMAGIYRRLHIKSDEIILEEKRAKKAYAAGLGKEWDAFISHASKDKDAFVRPLAQALIDSGLRIWYD